MQIASLPTIAKISAFLLKVMGHEKGKEKKKKGDSTYQNLKYFWCYTGTEQEAIPSKLLHMFSLLERSNSNFL